jgi:hypothetical protein
MKKSLFSSQFGRTEDMAPVLVQLWRGPSWLCHIMVDGIMAEVCVREEEITI